MTSAVSAGEITLHYCEEGYFEARLRSHIGRGASPVEALAALGRVIFDRERAGA